MLGGEKQLIPGELTGSRFMILVCILDRDPVTLFEFDFLHIFLSELDIKLQAISDLGRVDSGGDGDFKIFSCDLFLGSCWSCFPWYFDD